MTDLNKYNFIYLLADTVIPASQSVETKSVRLSGNNAPP